MNGDEYVILAVHWSELTVSITAGAVRTTEAQKKAFAKESHAFNLKSKKFRVSSSNTVKRS